MKNLAVNTIRYIKATRIRHKTD